MTDQNWHQIQAELVKLFVHDLRNPVSALTANLSYIDTSTPAGDEDLKGAIEDSLVAVELLLRLSENMEMIGKLEAGEAVDECETPLGEYLYGVARKNLKIVASAGLTLKMFEPMPQVICRWRQPLVTLVLNNLILSSVRHAPPNSQVTLGAQLEDGRVALTVGDAGLPVPDDLTASIFTREGQIAVRKRSDGRYSRGWGLYAAGLAAATLNAEIKVSHEETQTLFSLRVPIES